MPVRPTIGQLHARCRRHHSRQGALRVFLPLRRQPHERLGARAQPAPPWLFSGRVVFWQRGGDKAGSIRIPYTGVISIESTLDHVGPITASVVDNALLLEVLAGPDGLDPRQYAPQTVRYTEALGRSVAGMKIRHCARGFWLGQFRAGRGARSSPRR